LIRAAGLALATAIALGAGLGEAAGQTASMTAGFAPLRLTDPVEGGPMAGIVVYPTAAAAGRTTLGPFEIEAVPGAPPLPGPFPLVVISHGTGGSQLGHHDSLTHLARHGFVAASVTHPRDNFQDNSGFATDLQLLGRVRHLAALIDAVLANPVPGLAVDPARIGAAGFSAGGYTIIVAAGGKPDFAGFARYCAEQPDDPMNRLCGQSDAAQRWRTRPDLALTHEPRLKAAFVMAPALGFLFDRAGLADVRIPIRLYRPSADEVLRHPYNAERIRQSLPLAPEYEVVEGAGHFVFLAPCSAELARLVPDICRDPPGIDRAAIHARINAEMVEFFRRTLR
jgi:predicted dienelactone hydrolase